MPIHRTIAAFLLTVSLVVCSGPTDPEDTGPNVGLDVTWMDLEKACPPDAPAYSLSDAARDSLPVLDGEPRTSNETWAAWARAVPGGWGGMFYDRTSVDEIGAPLTMYLVDQAKAGEAIAALIPLVGESGWAHVAEELPDAVVKQGRWDFAQLFDWYRYLNVHVWAVSGVHLSGINVSSHRIDYGVIDEETRERVTAVLNALDPPCFLVAMAIRSPAWLLDHHPTD
jgi:hypothetical protein